MDADALLLRVTEYKHLLVRDPKEKRMDIRDYKECFANVCGTNEGGDHSEEYERGGTCKHCKERMPPPQPDPLSQALAARTAECEEITAGIVCSRCFRDADLNTPTGNSATWTHTLDNGNVVRCLATPIRLAFLARWGAK